MNSPRGSSSIEQVHCSAPASAALQRTLYVEPAHSVLIQQSLVDPLEQLLPWDGGSQASSACFRPSASSAHETFSPTVEEQVSAAPRFGLAAAGDEGVLPFAQTSEQFVRLLRVRVIHMALARVQVQSDGQLHVAARVRPLRVEVRGVLRHPACLARLVVVLVLERGELAGDAAARCGVVTASADRRRGQQAAPPREPNSSLHDVSCWPALYHTGSRHGCRSGLHVPHLRLKRMFSVVHIVL